MSAHSNHLHGHHRGSGGAFKTSAQATIHCLTGCVIGEVLGLSIGVTFGLGIMADDHPGHRPRLRHRDHPWPAAGDAGKRGVGWMEALRIIWVGEVISIGVMEVVMNFVDFQTGAEWPHHRSQRGCSGAAFCLRRPQVSWPPGRSITGCSSAAEGLSRRRARLRFGVSICE